MRGLLVITLLTLIGGTIGAEAKSDLTGPVWSTYRAHCPSIVADTNGYFTQFDEKSLGRAYVINSLPEHNYLAFQIDYGDYKLRYDAGMSGDRTFTSCGVESSKTGSNLKHFADSLVEHARTLAPNVVVSGGKIAMKELSGGSISSADQNYFFYITGLTHDLDTVTFIQLAPGFLSIYFHHVFNGRVGLPDPLPASAQRLR